MTFVLAYPPANGFVGLDCVGPIFSKAYPTAEAAETRARSIVKARGGRIQIVETSTRPHIAVVSCDALGRVWTDIMTGPTVDALL